MCISKHIIIETKWRSKAKLWNSWSLGVLKPHAWCLLVVHGHHGPTLAAGFHCTDAGNEVSSCRQFPAFEARQTSNGTGFLGLLWQHTEMYLFIFFKIMLEAKSPRWGASRISFFWSLSRTCKGLFRSCVLTTLLLCVLPSCLSLCLLGHQPGRTRASSWWPQLKSPSPNTL